MMIWSSASPARRCPRRVSASGVDRLLAALDAKGKGPGRAQGPVVVTVMDRTKMADYMALVNELRQAGIRAEMYLGNPKNFGNQLKYADKRESPVAIIMGEDEAARGVVQVKDLILGAQIAADASVEEWKSQTQQVEVPARRHGRHRARDIGPLRMSRAEDIATGLLGQMLDAGAVRVTPDILQPAGTLFWTCMARISARGPMSPMTRALGEMMLRPDFTVPVVAGAYGRRRGNPHANAYAGAGVSQAIQPAARGNILQVGYEVFRARYGRPRPMQRCSRCSFPPVWKATRLRPVTGDMGLLTAAVAGDCSTTERTARGAFAPCLAAQNASARCWSGCAGKGRWPMTALPWWTVLRAAPPWRR